MTQKSSKIGNLTKKEANQLNQLFAATVHEYMVAGGGWEFAFPDLADVKKYILTLPRKKRIAAKAVVLNWCGIVQQASECLSNDIDLAIEKLEAEIETEKIGQAA